MRALVFSLAVGCGGDPDTEPIPLPVEPTADTGFTPPGAAALTTQVLRHSPCDDSERLLTLPTLTVRPQDNHKMEVWRTGWTDSGCGCDGPIRAWMDEEAATIDVWFDYGTCPVELCCASRVRVNRIPLGEWTVRLWGLPEPVAQTILQ